MIKNLKIKAHGAVSEAKLFDLPTITVVCGPNSSGKSTLLKAITDSSKAFVGKSITDDDIGYLFEATKGRTGWHGNPGYPVLNNEYINVLKAASKKKKLWFLDEADEFNLALAEEYGTKHMLRGYSYGAQVSDQFRYVIGQAVNPVLLPPKRVLTLNPAVNSNTAVQPSGDGIVSALFSAKNQPNTSVARKFYDQLTNAFNAISGGFSFEIFLGTNNSLSLQFSSGKNDWFPAQDCGLGLQDLLIILYFSFEEKTNLVCIEEPESHLHPDMQRRLLFYLKQHSEKQLILSTHSNVFLNNALVDKVLVTSYDGKKISVSDATSRASVLDDLGYSVTDNLVSDLVILVEGPTDVPVIEELLLKTELFAKYRIKIWPLGGDIMDQLDLDVLAENYKLIALVDNDPGSKVVRERFEEKCGQRNIPVTVLKRYAIENYFSVSALRGVFKSKIPEELLLIDPDKKLEDQIGFNVKKSNRKIVREMSLVDLEGTDLLDFINQIRKNCESL